MGGLVLVALPAVAARPSPGCSKLPPSQELRGIEETMVVGEQTRSYILDVPRAALGTTPVPLVFDFHGFQHSAAGVWRVSEFREFGATHGFVTVYPQGLTVRLRGREGAGWELREARENRDVQFVHALLTRLADRFCIDLERVFATGFSNGAFFTHVLACAREGAVAAIAPVGGGLVDVPCTPARPVAVIIHHGTGDDRVPVERARALRTHWARLNQCALAPEMPPGGECARYVGCRQGGEVVYCEHAGGHHWPAGAGRRIWEFFAR